MKNMKNTIFAALGIFTVLFFTHCSTPNYTRLDKKMMNIGVLPVNFKQEIPIEVINNLLYVKVNIQGSDYTFLISTDYKYSLIDSTLAKKIQTTPILKDSYENEKGEKSTFQCVNISKMSIGNIDFSEVGCGMDNLNQECNCKKPKHIDGVLGVGFLSKAVWQFNYKSKKAIICNHQDSLRFAPDKKVLPFRTGAEDDEDRDGVPEPFVNFRVDQNYIGEIYINTSNCADFYIPNRLAQQSKAIKSKYLLLYGLPDDKDKLMDSSKIRLIKNVSIGDNLNINSTLLSSGSRDFNQIGGGFLSQFVCTFDWSKSQLVLSDYQPKAKESSFGYYVIYKNGKIIVHSLIKNTAPERAGLQIGDEVTSINHQDLSNVSQEQYELLDDVYNKDEVKISIKRGEKILDFTFPKVYLEDLFK
jgi:PDZ domain